MSGDAMEFLEAEKKKILYTTEVKREDNVRYDLGNLAVFDPKPVDLKGNDEAEALRDAARDNLQLLFNKVFHLPVIPQRDGTMGVVVQLPRCSTPVPREKHIPEPKPKTKWEEFAKKKGIKKTKKDSKVFDENTDTYRPRYGFGSASKDPLKDWLREVKPSDNPAYEDPFEEAENKKKKGILKQREREAANKVLAEKKTGPRLPSTLSLNAGGYRPKKDIDKAISIAQRSTISMGKFDKLNKGEKSVREKKTFSPLIQQNEASEQLKTLKRVFSKVEDKMSGQKEEKAVNNTIQRAKRQKVEGKHKTGIKMRKGIMSDAPKTKAKKTTYKGPAKKK
ncbi:ribosome biogenesis regulatory protein [Planoprotostelium fungivorum]|uniref:Ribosome biogenesis regulatory protein n=1 Tax=Planoprotostelium fungivorum TaxID=1890364 RepID=A0A2P6NG97_9EUKA|nr:ribosome biogenesis regulatory protein [Planoprotostelium fungivorum]